MNDAVTAPSASSVNLPPEADLQTILDAWQQATDRLQRTHLALKAEVSRLSDELEAKNRELARENRLADLGRIAAHVAHEARNSLMPITLYLSMLKRRLHADADSVDVIAKIESAVTDLEGTVTDLLQFTADRPPRCRSVELRELVEQVCESVAPQLAAQHIWLEIDVDESAAIWADPDMLRRALLNLTLNALDVMPSGGELIVSGFQGDEGYELEVADSGPGLGDDKTQLFEPFFTTKSEGTGLGLAIVRRIAQAHGGDVTACNCPEGGAAFTLHFPAPMKQRAVA